MTSRQVRTLALAALAALALACSDNEAIVNPPEQPVPVAVVELVSPPAQLTVGDETQLTAQARDAHGRPLSGRAMTWESADTTVATVSQTGRVTALMEGLTYLSATSEGRQGRSLLRVVPRIRPVATVSIQQGRALTVDVGDHTLLTAIAHADDGSILTGRSIGWSSDRPAVATVSALGLLEGLAIGEATITASIEGKTASLVVTVTSSVAWMEMDPVSLSMTAGEVRMVQAYPRTPQGDVLNTTIVWASDDSSVASVVAPGRVVARNPGVARITATAQGKSGTTFVIVTAWPEYALRTVNDAPPPVTLYTTTERDANGVERAVRYEVVSGLLRMLFGSDRYEQSFFLRIYREGQVVTGGQFVTGGTTWYDFPTGTMHFLPNDGSPEFVSTPSAQGFFAVRQRYKMGAPEVVLTYQMP